jgi:hypothetical protein
MERMFWAYNASTSSCDIAREAPLASALLLLLPPLLPPRISMSSAAMNITKPVAATAITVPRTGAA